MRRYRLILPVVLFVAALLGGTLLPAQSFSTRNCEGGDASGDGFMARLLKQRRACEIRTATVPVIGGQVKVRGFNGNVEVVGEDRADIALEARVEAHGHSVEDAQSVMREVRVVADGTITAEGPKESDGRGWSVSYRLHVPRRIGVQIQESNGAVNLASLEGEINARTSNGGLSLSDLAGNVHASTSNGSVSVVLEGGAWHGNGLFVRSTNGSFHVRMADGYSAHLMAHTTNGDVSVNLPGWQGRRQNWLDTTVGKGGATLDFGTTNGSISFAAH